MLKNDVQDLNRAMYDEIIRYVKDESLQSFKYLNISDDIANTILIRLLKDSISETHIEITKAYVDSAYPKAVEDVFGLYQVKLSANDSGYANNSVNKVRAISNYPNPFNPDTNISFSLSDKAEANILIYNIKGQIVREMGVKPYKFGVNTINWDGKDNSYNPVSSGIYFIRIKTGTESHTHKMLMMK